MTFWKLRTLTLLLLVCGIATGSWALFTNGGNGNNLWLFLFWVVSIGLFACIPALIFSAWFGWSSYKDAKLLVVGLFGLSGFLFASPIGLFGFVYLCLPVYAFSIVVVNASLFVKRPPI
jgi:hypothetical protein